LRESADTSGRFFSAGRASLRHAKIAGKNLSLAGISTQPAALRLDARFEITRALDMKLCAASHSSRFASASRLQGARITRSIRA